MKAFDDIRKKLSKMAANGRNPMLEELLKEAADDIVSDAFATKYRGNYTFNQHDAFGWGLYFNGMQIDKGYGGMAKQATVPRTDPDGGEVWGREEADRILDEYSPDRKGYVLYVINAMWYSAVHEYNKQVVISQEEWKLRDLAERFKGEVEIVGF